jgi:phospholipid/cholesterol/gamma-HCH transport system permease protein
MAYQGGHTFIGISGAVPPHGNERALAAAASCAAIVRFMWLTSLVRMCTMPNERPLSDPHHTDGGARATAPAGRRRPVCAGAGSSDMTAPALDRAAPGQPDQPNQPSQPTEPALDSVEAITRYYAFGNPLSGGLRAIGGFFAMSLDTFRALFRRGFPFGEFFDQVRFLMGVSLVPAILFSIPFIGIATFLINQLLIQIGAIDLSGAGVALFDVLEVAPVASLFIVAGAGATAITADLGARKIREEIDAMEVLGIDPVHRLVLPRVLAATLLVVCLNGVLTLVCLVSGYIVSVVMQGASAGSFLANITLLVHGSDFAIAEFKAFCFGIAAGLIACYRGLTVKGGPKGVGQAVNETVILTFVVLAAIDNTIASVTVHAGH